MDKTIKIDGRDIKFRATAGTPRLYRILTMRDIVKDINALTKHFNEVQDEGTEDISNLSIEDLTIFENVAYTMAKHANPDMPEKSVEEWLDTFEMFSIWQILPQLLDLWRLNVQQTSQPKKK